MRLVELAPGRLAHASGALWLPETRTALMADVHLGYGWALRRRGQLGPVGDDRLQRKLSAAIEELRPATIVFLGDVVHAPRPAEAEREIVVRALRSVPAQVVVVLGNHDRAFRRDYPELPVEVCESWTGEGLVAVHGDKELPQAGHVVAGHLHPAIGVVDHAGASHKMPVFVAGRSLTLLPAFTPLAAGFDVRAGLPYEMGDVRIVAASGKRAVDLGPLTRLRVRS